MTEEVETLGAIMIINDDDETVSENPSAAGEVSVFTLGLAPRQRLSLPRAWIRSRPAAPSVRHRPTRTDFAPVLHGPNTHSPGRISASLLHTEEEFASVMQVYYENTTMCEPCRTQIESACAFSALDFIGTVYQHAELTLW